MDASKAQFKRLAGTQIILFAALIAIAFSVSLFWIRYSHRVKMVPILGDQTLDASDIGPIDRELELAGVPHDVVAGKVLVPADRRAEVLAKLMFARVLPVDTHDAFQKTSAPMDAKHQADCTQATANELSEIISRFPGVTSAQVVLSVDHEPRIEGSIPPSATVSITTNGTVEDKKSLTRAATDGVSNAVAGLARDRVSVVIDSIKP